jgi:pimeloyl-ACP methyl ester carboxylesterase
VAKVRYKSVKFAREATVPDPYVTIGTGDRHVIAVHGWFGSARGWGLVPDFVDGDTFTYAFMNLRGYGERKDVPGEYTTEEAATDAVALADELGWERFSLVGHSMGGKLIQHVLLDAPDRVTHLVAVNPVPASGVPFDEQSWALFSGAAENPRNRATIIDFTTGNRLTKTFIDSVVQHSLENSTVQAFGAYLSSWGKVDFSDQVTGNPARVKVIVGEHDPALGAEAMRQTWLQYYPNAELTVLPNAGHYPMFETPVALVTTVEEFLRQA